jgi:F0F1-type ATP synthase delta subunit
MIISRKKLAQVILNNLIDQPMEKVAKIVAAYLIDNKMTAQLDLLMKDLALLIQKEHKVLHVTAKSAYNLDPDKLTDLANLLKRITNTDITRWNSTIDSDLIGGLTIETPELELDLSIQARLKQLRAY